MEKKNTQLTQIKAGKEYPGSLASKTSPSMAGDAGSIPGWGTKTPTHHSSHSQKTKTQNKQCCYKFNTDFKNDPHNNKS